MCASPDLYDNVPISALSYRTRSQMGRSLDITHVLTTHDGICRDWRGVAALANFHYDEIQAIQKETECFSAVLRKWGDINSSHEIGSVGKLLRFLETIERFDVIDDCKHLIDKDIEKYQRDRELWTDARGNLPVDCSFISFSSGIKVEYDAFICAAPSNFAFVKELIDRLESPLVGVRLFVPERDLAVGVFEFSTLSKIMDQWCRKVIFLLSPEMKSCSNLRIYQNYAESLHLQQRGPKAYQKLIPVIVEHCDTSGILQQLTKINFDNPDVPSWSWHKLLKALDVSEDRIQAFEREYFPSTTNNNNNNTTLPNALAVRYPTLDGSRTPERSPRSLRSAPGGAAGTAATARECITEPSIMDVVDNAGSMVIPGGDKKLRRPSGSRVLSAMGNFFKRKTSTSSSGFSSMDSVR